MQESASFINHPREDSSKRYKIGALTFVSAWGCYFNFMACLELSTWGLGTYIMMWISIMLCPLVGGYFASTGNPGSVLTYSSLIVFVAIFCFDYGEMAHNAYWASVFAPVLYFFGAPALVAAQFTITSKWFFGYDLALAVTLMLVLSLFVGKVGSWALYDVFYMDVYCYIAGSIAVVSLLSALVLDYYEKKWERNYQVRQVPSNGSSFYSIHSDMRTQFGKLGLLFTVGIMVYCVLQCYMSDILIEQFCFDLYYDYFFDIRTFPFFVCLFFAPIIARFIDKKGRRIQCLIGSSMFLTVGYSLTMLLPSYYCYYDYYYYYSQNWAYLTQGLIGLGQAFFIPSFWASIPLLVPERVLGITFGLAISLINVFFLPSFYLSFVAAPYYLTYLIYFAVVSFLSIFVGLGLYKHDMKTGQKLQRAPRNIESRYLQVPISYQVQPQYN